MKANPVVVYLRAALAAVVALVRKYPARAVSLAVSAVVFVAASLGVVIPAQSVQHAIEMVLPILLSGELTHHNVSPAVPPSK